MSDVSLEGRADDMSAGGNEATRDSVIWTSKAEQLARTRRPWAALDGAIVLYTVVTAMLVLACYHTIAEPLPILAFHALVLFVVFTLPQRGAPWERATPNEPVWRKTLRGGARFLRYSYPLLLVLFFFEEVQQTVNAIAPTAPYWFEPYLYSADRWLFGELPTLFMSSWVGMPQDEILHFFYFSYYLILIGAVVVAWFGPKGSKQPGPGFETALTSVMVAFFLAFIWYPWLPARGPWENPDLMAGLPAFQGVIFTPIMEWIIDHGAVSGGCFPSSHVAGSWGMVFGLAKFHRRAALGLGVLALGMSFACVYTRYHHGVDVPAGLLAGIVGAWIGWTVTRRSQ
jgi:membrane-associated phospholipid phosphatase